jgi:cysteine-S-conjugate beta-lyase
VGTVAEGSLPAWVADMDFPVAPVIRSALVDLVDCSDLGYPNWLGGTPLRAEFARRMADRYRWHLYPGAVREQTDLIQAVQLILRLTTSPGDSVAIQTPNYPPFLATLNAMGLQPVAFPFIDSDEGWVPDFVEFERSLRVVRPKVLILVNPHNPTGRVHTRTELLRNVELAAEFNLIVISDEIHAELIYAPHRHIPFASLSPDAASRTMTITSAGKAFNLAALRCAVAHFGAESVLARRDAEHPNLYGAVSVAAVVGTLAAWQQGHDWQDTLIVLDRNRHHVHDALRDAVPSARHHLPQGTYLSWVDVSALGIDDPVSQILQHGKVMVDGGTQFGPAAALSDVLPGSDAGRRVLRRGRLGALGVGRGHEVVVLPPTSPPGRRAIAIRTTFNYAHPVGPALSPRDR